MADTLQREIWDGIRRKRNLLWFSSRRAAARVKPSSRNGITGSDGSSS
jgi:hypothetical protein